MENCPFGNEVISLKGIRLKAHEKKWLAVQLIENLGKRYALSGAVLMKYKRQVHKGVSLVDPNYYTRLGGKLFKPWRFKRQKFLISIFVNKLWNKHFRLQKESI